MSGWSRVCLIAEIPVLGARVIEAAHASGDNVAIFRTADDRVFALRDRCPHKGGPLSQGIVFGESVACPLHGWNIDLASGCAHAPDRGCAQRAIELRSGQRNGLRSNRETAATMSWQTTSNPNP